jgi:Zn-dependent M16 (insulinase) family peptidase
MEHAVLGGSRKFPVREPFFEMVKMSMATYINASTYPTFTVYPIATNVKKDFFNLVEVYLDAVFHPELKEDTFRREGHHLALENNADPTSPLKISGIVYNEMKGAYSAPESIMWELGARGLYPETPVGRDSGGDPDHIPNLTYRQFLEFHKSLYHPSNARIFIYGDIPTVEHLKFLAPVLDEFDRKTLSFRTCEESLESSGRKIEIPRKLGMTGIVDGKETPVFPREPRWSSPRRIEQDYPIGATEDAGARTFLTLNWIVGDALHPDTVTDWEVLSAILLGNEAAPLKKALIDSKLGTDVFFAGSWASAYEQEFHIGIKGSEPDRGDKFERFVLDTLERIAAEPFHPDRVAAAFQQLAYDRLEVKTLFPMHLLDAVNQAWPYDADPLTFLRMSELLDSCRHRFGNDPLMFNRLIRDGLLNNPHRLLVSLRPDREVQSRADAAFAKQMADRKATLSPEQIAGIAKAAAELEAAQGVPNSPDALAKLPQLKTSDLPAGPRHIPTTAGRVGEMTVLRNDVFANGVNYFEFDVDLAGLPVELYRWLPRFCDVFNKLGAAGQSYEKIAERRAACTGGLWCVPVLWRHASDDGRSLRRLRFGLKTLDRQADPALGLLEDLIFGVDPTDRARMEDVLRQAVTWYRTTLVNDGLVTARRQAARGLGVECALEHQFLSPEALREVEAMAGNFDRNFDALVKTILTLREFLLNRRRWTVSFTGSNAVFDALTGRLGEWGARMRDDAVVDAPVVFAAGAHREGLAGPMKVAHCAKVMPAPHLAHPDVPLFRLGVYLARFDYFLPEIRFKGNAYGGGASHDDANGTFSLFSFRDPHIVETLRVFDGLREYVAAQNWTQTDVDRAIIGSAKEAERPIRPGEATGQALARHLRGDTKELRERRYAATLSATTEGVKEILLRYLDANEAGAAVCVVSSREKLSEANIKLGEQQLAVSDILS